MGSFYNFNVIVLGKTNIILYMFTILKRNDIITYEKIRGSFKIIFKTVLMKSNLQTV